MASVASLDRKRRGRFPRTQHKAASGRSSFVAGTRVVARAAIEITHRTNKGPHWTGALFCLNGEAAGGHSEARIGPPGCGHVPPPLGESSFVGRDRGRTRGN